MDKNIDGSNRGLNMFWWNKKEKNKEEIYVANESDKFYYAPKRQVTPSDILEIATRTKLELWGEIVPARDEPLWILMCNWEKLPAHIQVLFIRGDVLSQEVDNG
jgi:hypothetical protein